MACRDAYELNERDDVDFLNSTVDECFSFIYDEPESELEFDSEDDFSLGQNSLAHNDNLEKVVDEHFSFLLDQDAADNSFSSAEQPLYDNFPLCSQPPVASTDGTSRFEPIYCNLETFNKTTNGDGSSTLQPPPFLIPLLENPETNAPCPILDIFIPGDSSQQSPTVPEVIKIPVVCENADAPPKERKLSAVYLNADQSEASSVNGSPVCLTILTSSDDTPCIYALKQSSLTEQEEVKSEIDLQPTVSHYPRDTSAFQDSPENNVTKDYEYGEFAAITIDKDDKAILELNSNNILFVGDDKDDKLLDSASEEPFYTSGCLVNNYSVCSSTPICSASPSSPMFDSRANESPKTSSRLNVVNKIETEARSEGNLGDPMNEEALSDDLNGSVLRDDNPEQIGSEQPFKYLKRDEASFASRYPENPSKIVEAPFTVYSVLAVGPTPAAGGDAGSVDAIDDLKRLHQLDMEVMQLEVGAVGGNGGDVDQEQQTSDARRVDNLDTSQEEQHTEPVCKLDEIVEAVNPSVLPSVDASHHPQQEILVAASDPEGATSVPLSVDLAPVHHKTNSEPPSNAKSTSRLRRSLRRLRDARLSGRRSRKTSSSQSREAKKGAGLRSSLSEETVVRREIPAAPEVGLPSVRSPRASAVLLPSLIAALTPSDPPREILPLPGDSTGAAHTRRVSCDFAQSHHPLTGRAASLQNLPLPQNASSQDVDHPRPLLLNLDLLQPPVSTSTPTCVVPILSSSSADTPGTPNNFGTQPGVWFTPITSTVNRPRAEFAVAPLLRTGTQNRALQSSDTSIRSPRHQPNSQLVTNNNTNAVTSPTRSQAGRVQSNRREVPNRHRARRGHTRSADSNNIRVLSRPASVSSITSDNNNNSSSIIPTPSSTRDDNQRSPTSEAPSISRQISASSQTSVSERTSDSGGQQLQERSRDSLDLSRSRLTGSQSPSRGFVPPKRGVWPHSFSGLMSALAVTVTMFNLSRFATFGAHFGWQFPIQWLVISLVVGLPLLSFFASVGQYIGGSVVDMWVVSPIFQGVGYGLLLAQCVFGVYCCVPLAWLFTYFRDSFDLRRFKCLGTLGCSSAQNLSTEINYFVPHFFTSSVLQRYDDGVFGPEEELLEVTSSPLLPTPSPSPSFLNSLGSVKFDLSFNIGLIWIITFIALSRGSRMYGKICYIIFLMPCACYLAFCGNLIYLISKDVDITEFKADFTDRHSWMAACREAFLVWGLNGAVIQQIAANNKRRHKLWRDTTILSIVTIVLLCLASYCGLLCRLFLNENNIVYNPSSFETSASRAFVAVSPELSDDQEVTTDGPLYEIPEAPNLLHPMGPIVHPTSSDDHFYSYDNFYVGIKIRKRYMYNEKSNRMKNGETGRSGYNVMHFLFELFPAMMFMKDETPMAFWPPLFFIAFLLFGLAQQLSVWHCVVQGVIRINYEKLHKWETIITFFCCLIGFAVALPMSSGAGLEMVFFLDYLIGCLWWIMILQLIQIFAILFVRGKPCSAQEMALRLLDKCQCCCSSLKWLATPVSVAWTLVLPVGLLVLSISAFQIGNYREIFAWEADFWPRWVCQLASGLQLFPLFLVPLVGLIQTCRYLSDPRQDFFQRIQHLYRPPQHTDQEADDETFLTQRSDEDLDALQLPYSGANPPPNPPSVDTESPARPYSDPPPKYTPPPSYSTATGSSLFKLLNRSARGLRHLQNTLRQASSPPRETPSSNPAGSSTSPPTRSEPYIPPPDYPPSSSSRLLPISTIQDHTAPPSSSNPTQPPQYATLDPLRRRQHNRTSIIPPLLPLDKGVIQDGGFSPSLRPSRGNFSRSSLRNTLDLRRSLRNSLRRSAHRLAGTFSPILGGNPSQASLESVRAASNLELTTHSEA